MIRHCCLFFSIGVLHVSLYELTWEPRDEFEEQALDVVRAYARAIDAGSVGENGAIDWRRLKTSGNCAVGRRRPLRAQAGTQRGGRRGRANSAAPSERRAPCWAAALRDHMSTNINARLGLIRGFAVSRRV